LCGSRKNKYPTHGRSLEISKTRGVIKANILEAKYEAKLEFLGGGDAKQKPSLGEYGYFLELHICQHCCNMNFICARHGPFIHPLI